MKKEIVGYVLRVEVAEFERGETYVITVYNEISPFVRGGENHAFQRIKIIIEDDDLKNY